MTLHRIKALRDFGNIKAGDLGGWIEKEENLSHDGDAWVCGNAKVYGNAKVSGSAKVCDNARVASNNSIMWISCIGSRNDTVTFFRSANDDILVTTGCFCGTIDAFADAVEGVHGDNEHGKAYKLAIELAKLRIKDNKDEQKYLWM